MCPRSASALCIIAVLALGLSAGPAAAGACAAGFVQRDGPNAVSIHFPAPVSVRIRHAGVSRVLQSVTVVRAELGDKLFFGLYAEYAVTSKQGQIGVEAVYWSSEPRSYYFGSSNFCPAGPPAELVPAPFCRIGLVEQSGPDAVWIHFVGPNVLVRKTHAGVTRWIPSVRAVKVELGDWLNIYGSPNVCRFTVKSKEGHLGIEGGESRTGGGEFELGSGFATRFIPARQ